MAILDYKASVETIPLPNGSNFQVRGLGVEDLTVLLANYLEPISRAAELYAKHQTAAFSNANLVNFLGVLASDFPGLTMEIIALAADEPEAKDTRLALGIQLAALSAIVKLTIEDAGGLGNLFAHLAALVKGALQNASELRQIIPSRGSTGASVKTSTS